MFNRIHQKLGTAGFIISIVALVAALGGGAYAANGGSAGRATASAKAKQGKQGKPGKTGPAGPAGAAGAQGPVGPAGPKGDTGAAGANGTNGTNGATGAAGVKGATGPTGTTGFSGFTETLPAGKTETGAWNVTQGWSGPTVLNTATAISFPIPLAAGGGEGSAFGFDQKATEEEEFGTSGCNGTVANPTAPPGRLCVYTRYEAGQNAQLEFVEPQAFDGTFSSYGSTGANLDVGILAGNETPSSIEAAGTWAVTAPTAP